jgi:hypothetical protein
MVSSGSNSSSAVIALSLLVSMHYIVRILVKKMYGSRALLMQQPSPVYE